RFDQAGSANSLSKVRTSRSPSASSNSLTVGGSTGSASGLRNASIRRHASHAPWIPSKSMARRQWHGGSNLSQT
ncbi:MAG TPA: hypothetical protein VK818_02865, partial [Methylomirabilota bacterium]|nr:hypothetical protein [Methylomirabilota bacterium]